MSLSTIVLVIIAVCCIAHIHLMENKRVKPKPVKIEERKPDFAYFKGLIPKHNGLCGADIVFFKVDYSTASFSPFFGSVFSCEKFTKSNPKKTAHSIGGCFEMKLVQITEDYYESKFQEFSLKLS